MRNCEIESPHPQTKEPGDQPGFRAGNGTIIEPFLKTLKLFICLEFSCWKSGQNERFLLILAEFSNPFTRKRKKPSREAEPRVRQWDNYRTIFEKKSLFLQGRMVNFVENEMSYGK